MAQQLESWRKMQRGLKLKSSVIYLESKSKEMTVDMDMIAAFQPRPEYRGF
jgi:hypothetical protein